MKYPLYLALAEGRFAYPNGLSQIVVSKGSHGFIETVTQEPFTPWGVNYDHDEKGRLIEDYWHDEWPKIVEDFQEIKALGANVVRVHPQFGKFMETAEKPNAKNLDRLSKLVELAEKTGLYLNITGLGCYHKKDVPAWYDALEEKPRWAAQAAFWRAVAGRCKNSPAIFCYDLMNEPVVPGGKRKPGDWLGPAFGDKHFVQMITLDQASRPRFEIAREWLAYLTTELRKVDDRHLVSVGMVDWSLDRKGLTSGFIPEKVSAPLDFISVHIYPERNKIDESLETLRGFQVGKPVVIEETFALKCDTQDWRNFVNRSAPDASGWIGFYWGKTPDELKKANTIADGILLNWLEEFRKGPPKS
ncbi:MAG: cellulase family glycosylhydrolase [bacterium]